MITLRPYQADLVARCAQAFGEVRSVVMQLPTGGGKTATAAEVIRRTVARGNRVVFGAHLDSLVTDTHARLAAAGVRAGFVQAGRPSDPSAPVQVCSLATLYARGTRPPAELVIVDECHRAMAKTVRAILSAYPEASILGLTATPQRGDGQPLGAEFDRLVLGPSVRALTAQWHLVPCDVIAPAECLEKLLEEPVEAYKRHARGTRAIVFAESVEHAEHITGTFRAFGIPAATITGETKREEREAARAACVAGELLVLVSVDVFVEGFDLPAIETVIVARNTDVVGRWLQMIGRGLRPSLGKQRCTVLDLTGCALRLGLPDEDRVWSLDGKPRRGDPAAPIRRCEDCGALFSPALSCPRCGSTVSVKSRPLPKILTAEEKRLVKEEKLSHLSQAERDARYLRSLVYVATTRMRLRGASAHARAVALFEKRFGRSPVAA